MHAETLPPYRHVSSRPITLAGASNMLSTYLTNSESHPHLHPDALITPSGVNFSSHGGFKGGVVMHNLRRVAAGLRGEYLEPEGTPEPEDQEQGNASGANGKTKQRKRRDAEPGASDGEEWQNMSEWEREEGEVEVGEVGDRTNVVQEGGEAPEIEDTGRTEVDKGSKKKRKKNGEEKLDKNARKKAKKQRNKERKAQKEKERAKGSD